MFDACIYFNVTALARVLKRIWDEAFSRVGLSPSHAYVLLLVIEKPGIVQSEISTAMELTPSTVSRFIDTLAGKGLVTRRTEGKVAHVDPTPAGTALQSELTAIAGELSGFIGERISQRENAILVEQTAAIRRKLERTHP